MEAEAEILIPRDDDHVVILQRVRCAKGKRDVGCAVSIYIVEAEAATVTLKARMPWRLSLSVCAVRERGKPSMGFVGWWCCVAFTRPEWKQQQQH